MRDGPVSSPRSPRSLRFVRVGLRALLVAALVVQASLTLFVIASRLAHPADLEWMTGAVMDHVERVREGHALYAPPSAGWFPLLYPPLYYWLVAALGGAATSARLLSVAATVAQGALVWSAARSLAATRFWSAVSVLVFVACFPFVGFWYDLERSDNLFGAIVLAGLVVLLRAKKLPAFVAAGALLALAALAKQQAVFYVAGAAVGLVLATRASDEPVARRDVLGFGAGAAAPLAVMIACAYATGSGAPAYYLVRMPGAHGVVVRLAGVVFERDAQFGFLLLGVTVAVAVAFVRARFRREAPRRDLLAAACLLAGFAGALASRLHIGGWWNVLIPWTTCASVAVGVVAGRIEARHPSAVRLALVVGVILAQLFQWRYDPRKAIPRAGSVAAEERLVAEVRSLERDGGDVLFPSRGHITRVRHFHLSALADVSRMEGRSPPQIREALLQRRYAAIVDDARYDGSRPKNWPPTILEDLEDLRAPLLASYFVARRIDYGAEPLALPAPATPYWVYLPRRVPLDVATEPTELRRRQVAEMHLAEQRFAALRRREAEPFSEADIEERAARAP